MSSSSRIVHRGNVSMYDAVGNHFVVALYATEVIDSSFKGAGVQWIEVSKSYQCKDGPVNLRDDGTFEIASSGTLISPSP